MSKSTSLSCRCGAVRAAVSSDHGKDGMRVVCHCKDCQNFAHFCDAADHILDPKRGTDIYLSRCAALRIEQGKDALACVHLTDKETLRWYCAECRTPMFNTFDTGKWPYLSVLVANIESVRLGPVVGHLFTEYVPDAKDLPKLRMLPFVLGVLKRMMKDFASGDRRRSALFDAKTLAPIAVPYRLNAEQRASLVAQRERSR